MNLNTRPILSVILPTFNVERFIEDCIRSVEDQDIDQAQYEVIVVDDGATDGSAARVAALQLEYGNVILVRQSNAGLSAARNTGIRTAKGKYLLFVDPDDCVERNCFAALIAVAEAYPGIDLVGCNYTVYLHSGLVVTPEFPTPERNPIAGIDYYRKFVAGDYHIWRYLFSREFLMSRELYFLDGISFEDVEFTPRLMFSAERVVFHNLPFYRYYLRPGSISTAKSEKHISSRLVAASNLQRFMREKAGGASHAVRVMFNEVTAECLLSAVSASQDFPGLFNDLSKKIRELPFFPLDLSTTGKHRWEAGILNRSIRLYSRYSYVISKGRLIRRKVKTVIAIALGPSPLKKFAQYWSRIRRPAHGMSPP